MPDPMTVTLDHHVAFDPAADFDAFLRSVPAKWAVYLLTDADDRPVQLLCVKNLRYSLEHRLGTGEDVGPTRRVNYRDLVRNVRWVRVHSTFEADWVYLEVARQIFPRTYQGMLGFRDAWFLHVDVDAKFPRYTKTNDLTVGTGQLVGPVKDKDSAGRLIQMVEDAFDLCRYYNVLLESPNGRACAYKEMGKCPAPCDGSVSIEQYCHLVRLSLSVLVDPKPYVREQEQRMRSAAAELRFETAAKIKTYVEQLSRMGSGAFVHARPLSDFVFVSLQRGATEGTAKVFLITPGGIEEVIGILGDAPRWGEILRRLLELNEARRPRAIDATAAERIALVSHHLFAPKKTEGAFLRLEETDEKLLAKAHRELKKQKPHPEADGEGVVKELQALGEELQGQN
jgi:excinuclease UvrABC nuclease subunit